MNVQKMQKLSGRKAEILASSQRNAADRQKFWERAAFFHEEDLRYLRFLVPEGLRVLELGCGIGNLLTDLKPNFGLGVDFSPAIIAKAKQLHPEMHFLLGDAENP